jgi:hypothetical protein
MDTGYIAPKAAFSVSELLEQEREALTGGA